MSKKMLINGTHLEENRVAIVDDGLLTELDIEIAGREQTKGNIYKAAVVRVEPGLQAAFVDYGAERLGFLQIGEIHPAFYPQKNGGEDNKSRPRINEILHRGQELLVQVVKEERGTKGAALTTYLSLAGRYMVLVPGSHLRGISRKIESAAGRRKIKDVMNAMNLPDDVGYIVRTAAAEQSEEELKRDLNYLVRLHANIEARNKQVQAPALIYKESNLVLRSIRDYFTSDMDEVLIDDPKIYQEARVFFQQVMPEYVHLVKLHQERRPIFSRYQIEEQIENISKNKVNLPSGGSIVIDTTEALVAIDVNSGKMAGEQGVEATAYKTNIEAAGEVARQLRLRDLGGLVVIDFIDMRDRKHTRAVEKALKEGLRNDKARVTVGHISQFGLLEMSRQRIKAALAEGAYNPCPHCSGTGRVKSVEAQAVAFFRKLQAAVAKGKVARLEGEVPLAVADYLLNEKRSELVDLEQRQKVSVSIKGRPDFVDGQVELEVVKREKDRPSEDSALVPLTAVPEEIQAVPEVIPTKEEAAKTSQEEPQDRPQEEQAGASKSSRRRSRRNRRRRGSQQQDALESVGENPAPSPDAAQSDSIEASEQREQVEASKPAPTGNSKADSIASGEDSTPKKRSRRRRGSARKGESLEQQRADSPSEDVTAAKTPDGEDSPKAMANAETTTSQTAVGQTEGASEIQAQKPSRRRRSAAKKTAKGDATEAAPKKAEPTAETPPATEAAKADVGEVAPKKPARKRSAGKKNEKAEETTPATETVKSDADESTPKKPARRRSSAKKAEKAVENTPEKETAKSDSSAQAPKKPSRKRSSATKSGQTAETLPTQESTAGDASAQTPKKPARRRSPAKKAEQTAETLPTQDATAGAAPAQAPKKPTRRRSTAKKTEEVAETLTTQDATTSDAAALTPKKPARTKAAPQKSESASETLPATEKKTPAQKTTRRRATTPKKAAGKSPSAGTPDSSSTTETNEKSPKKTSQRRKAAPVKKETATETTE